MMGAVTNRGIAMDQASTLRQAREAARMSQAHLAAASGVSKRTIIRAEQGANIQGESLRCICSVLGIDVSALPPALQAEPATPQSMLREHVARQGEEIRWQGVPDSAGWRHEIRYDALMWIHVALLAGTVLAAYLYGSTLLEHAVGNVFVMGLAAWLALGGFVASLAMVACLYLSAMGIATMSSRMETTIHAMTDKAFYTARTRGWDPTWIASIERVELPGEREECRVRARSPLWPMSRSIRLTEYVDGSERTVHVQGLPDLQGVARLMRGEPLAA